MFFKDVIGQEVIKERLVQSVIGQRVSHAQLFLGQGGFGTLAMALAYARFINCTNKQSADACGACPSCSKFNKYIHPDLHFVFPVVKPGNGKPAVSDDYLTEWRESIIQNPYLEMDNWLLKLGAENKQPAIYTEESAAILKKLNLKTYEGDYKIMIIWRAEKMNVTAANKLLKILEEPPEKTLFILIAESADSLLQTILSRCQLIKFHAIKDEDLHAAVRKVGVERQDTMGWIHLASGNYNRLLVLQDGFVDENNFLDKFINLMRLAYARKIPELVKWVDDMASIGREAQKGFLNYSLRMLRENFLLNTGVKPLVKLTQPESDFSSKFAQFINTDNVFAICDEFNLAAYHIESNGNAKIIFLDMAMKLVKRIKN